MRLSRHTSCRRAALAAILAGTLGPVMAEAAQHENPELRNRITLTTHHQKPSVNGIDKEACFPLREIQISGLELIDTGSVRSTVEPLAYDCIGNTLAKAIVGAINEAHAAAGFITTQGYLPDQDIRKTKSLKINVVTGRMDKFVYRETDGVEALPLRERLEKAWEPVREARGPWALVKAVSGLVDCFDDALDHFQILDSQPQSEAKIWLAFDLDPDDALNISDVQRGLDVLNKVPSNHAEAKLLPGSAPATSIVQIMNDRSDSFRAIAGYEINGTSINRSGNTVAKRARIDVAKDNLIGINDTFASTLASGLNSNEVQARVSVPWQRLKFAIDAGYSEQLSFLTERTEFLLQSANVTGSASYLLERNKEQQTTVETSLGWRQVQRHINAEPLTPQRVVPLRIGLSRVHSWEASSEGLLLGRELSYGFGVNRGLPIWNATLDPAKPIPSAPRAEFWKLDAALGVAQGLRDIGVLRIDVVGQWTDHPLYFDDQLTLGSQSSIRGFANTAAKVDRGVVVRSEFAARLPIDLLKIDSNDWTLLDDTLRALQPYAFADAGYGEMIADAHGLTRASVGGGMRYAYGRTNFDISIAQPVYAQGTTRIKYSPEVYFTLNLKLL
ncbi:Hemolysin activation/secretion protein [Methylobacterium brachiatum]|nr:Hemolysin activation/secretion protein [Methylobacterium brachiatum]